MHDGDFTPLGKSGRKLIPDSSQKYQKLKTRLHEPKSINL